MSDIQHIEIPGHTVSVRVDPGPEREGRPALWPSVGEYPVYDPILYTTMTTDDERNHRFRAALAQCSGHAKACRLEPGTQWP
ncbi:hypothetical protein [Streptomyces flaveolus]|uniref:hypothetical protein n=1 Tax=Streptomyces flaveolus TaxID=67297 RepID=UPI0037020698